MRFLRTAGKFILRGCLILFAVLAVIYLADDLYTRYRGKPTEQLKVGRLYAVVNHWNEVEYSVGSPAMETCVDALMPHFGFIPCWYLRKHPIEQVGP